MALRLARVVRAAVDVRRRTERGDVPGWVLITVMTAGLVAGAVGDRRDQLGSMLREALASVSG